MGSFDRKTSKQTSNSNSSTAADYAGYFGGLDTLTGGRLGEFATNGTQKLTPEQIQAYGGLGATRTADVNRQRAQAVEAIAADPNLNIAQRQRSTQLTDQDMQSRLDAINKETEAGVAALAQYNNSLSASDLELLIKAYYGGKGQTSYGKQVSQGWAGTVSSAGAGG